MKTTKNKNSNPNPGWSLRDQNYLDRYDNASEDPVIQMFTEEDLEEDEDEITYCCSFCKSKLDHLQQRIDNTIRRRNECTTYHMTNS
jgi:predicted transcriptional regulator